MRGRVFMTLTVLTTGGWNGSEEIPQKIAMAEAAVERLPFYQMVQTQQERFGSQMGPRIVMHIKTSGRNTYVKLLEGWREGAEILWVPEVSEKLKAHKGSFPDVTVHLDRHGSFIMNGQHHPVDHANFRYVVHNLVETLRRGKADPEFSARLIGAEKIGERDTDVIEMRCPWRTTEYTLRGGDEIWSLSERLGVDPFVLMHENGYAKVKTPAIGTKLRVPMFYGSLVTVAVDRTLRLPVRLVIRDGRGELYEQYEWTQIDLSTPITAADFDSRNSLYGF